MPQRADTTACPTSGLRFRWPWRPYQQRVLQALAEHLHDRRLHLVAAPGSGKTILGLEVVRRLGKPAVILSPTRTIRDQWLARLKDFLPPETGAPSWTSRDLNHPGFLTSITYQALLLRQRGTGKCALRDERAVPAPNAREISGLAERFQTQGVGTLVLDEAHHLRRAWWSALDRLARRIDRLTIVALTATPPYDVTGLEWLRYEQLCGAIDEEISIPEVVRSGTLCPHQDYIWAVRPQANEAAGVQAYDDLVTRFTAELQGDAEFARAVETHPWLTDAEAAIEDILDNPEFAVSLAILRRAQGAKPPKRLLRLLDAAPEELPGLDRRWWQVLLNHYLFGTTWRVDASRQAHRDALAKRLRRDGLLGGHRLRVRHSERVERSLAMTPAKIDACVQVHRLERALRADALRQVILADFVRDDALVSGATHASPKLGAWPLFCALVEALPPAERERIALLTGRLVVLHEKLAARLAAEAHHQQREIDVQTHGGIPAGFVRGGTTDGSEWVAALTRCLAEGQIHVLIGTRALLGEGWDAPAVNSLILVSHVGSFVMTNQMRGRAIRSDADQPDKIASIWHLLGLAPETPSGWSDVALLARRFDAFVGLSATGLRIESGLARMELFEPGRSVDPGQINALTRQRWAEHPSVGRRWQSAIEQDGAGRVLPSVDTRKPPTLRRFWFTDTLRHFLASTLAGAGSIYWWLTRNLLETGDNPTVTRTLIILACGATAVWSVPRLIRAAWLWRRHNPVDGTLRQMALALHEALVETGIIAASAGQGAVRIQELPDGTFSAALAETSFHESALYADSLAELLGPIANPRYLLTRPGRGWKVDYHAVPRCLGANRKLAEGLHEAWRRRLGGGSLIYTRAPTGRKTLLAARMRAFSTAMTPPSQRRDRWQ